MDELVDRLDEQGNYTGQTTLKSDAHLHGIFHPTVHIWFFTKRGEVLIQQRGEFKDTHPLLWDVSVAGHIGAGEDIYNAAIREVKEEIGLTIVKEDLIKVGVFKSTQQHRKNLIDNEYHHTFLCELKVPFSTLKKQDSEVEALTMIPLITFADEVWGLANTAKYVPHSTEYYKTIIKSVKDQL
ncbi:MAG: NUDIX domain-containing protein [Eudoraea sp.]|nr:NUDIX domain-containing protein [Eudoraea sp.]NNL02268.1 NUDIX domain-containing protein [Eudoraea sp.]